MFQICEEEELCRFIGIAQRIWFRRNEVVHDGPFMHPKILLQHAGEAWDLFIAANKKLPQPNINLEKPDGVVAGVACKVALLTIPNHQGEVVFWLGGTSSFYLESCFVLLRDVLEVLSSIIDLSI
jgi:hypothetical protein